MYLIFDIGGTFSKYALMKADGTIVDKGKFETKNKEGDTIDDFVDSLVAVYDNYKTYTVIEGISMSLPGQIDVENGIVYVGGALPFLHKVRFGKLMSDRCDHKPVTLENDAKCAALAEIWKGNASDCTNAVLFIIGTGVGGGVIIDRKVHRGNRMIAGEFSYIFDTITREEAEHKLLNVDDVGQLENKYGDGIYSLSKTAATYSLRVRVSKEKNIPLEQVTGELIYKWADEGDEICSNALKDMYFAIAKQCLNMYVILNPDVILIGGGISSEPRFIEGIRYYAKMLSNAAEMFKGYKIELCKFGNDSNLLGALYNFLQMHDLIK